MALPSRSQPWRFDGETPHGASAQTFRERRSTGAECLSLRIEVRGWGITAELAQALAGLAHGLTPLVAGAPPRGR